MEEKIMAVLNEICGAEDGELSSELDLFETGLLDSFGVVELFVALEEECGVRLDAELVTREQIATPARIIALLEKMA